MHLLQKFDDKTNEAGMVFLNGAHPREKTPTRQVEAAAGGLTSWWGQQVPFNEIVKSGALVKGSDGNYKGGAGFTMGWDDCSDTPVRPKRKFVYVERTKNTNSLPMIVFVQRFTGDCCRV